ncbi:hypothetical protein G6L28_03280 [Agrobacterium larrymoorei]|uniref:hypothetical protein n=1 Tax=Agrobacterium larrymoorei TaxID=160699 RepID=UPI0015726F60|nr:hypothetical protein [Agrobacterium larrymoorei]NTJ41621.1 hypothetical protein [Agrobacterium larrymoorei]
MNIDNNIGGSAYQNRSQHIEKPQAEALVPDAPVSASNGSSISFVNVLQSTSLANVLWTVKNDAPTEGAAPTISYEPSAVAESAWLRQAYTEH